MPTAGLSLVGFMEREMAFRHLAVSCIPPDASEAALERTWAEARARLGEPTDRAGVPEIAPFDKSDLDHVELLKLGWPQLPLPMNPENFCWIEVEKLLAYQFEIDEERSSFHTGSLQKPPSKDELLKICLPTVPPREDYQWTSLPQSLILRSKSLNVRLIVNGPVDPNNLRIGFNISLPWVHVIRYAGKCYLHNGFHRTFGAGLAGAKMVPCYLRETTDPNDLCLQAGATFELPQLQSSNPPTMEHFIQHKAQQVTIRAKTRVIHFSWSEYVIADE